MNRLILIAVFSVACVSMVMAGPETYSGKEMKQVATTPAPTCPNWSGFYVGVIGGYDRALFNPDLSLTGGWVGFNSRFEAEDAGSRDFDVDGAQVGGVVGFNWQFNHLVVGLEGSGAKLWARDSRLDHFLVGTPDQYRLSTSVETNYLATIGPRIGWTFCHFMPYITGGGAFGDIRFRQSDTFLGGGPSERETGGTDDSHVGWFIGGGLEYALTNHWHIRGDYKYVDFGDGDSFNADFGNGGGAPMHSHIELREHSATAALIYQF